MRAIPAEAIRHELPVKPDWFDGELANCVPNYNSMAMFRCVDGTKEMMSLDGKQIPKHRNPNLEAVPIKYTYWTRFHQKSQKHIKYASERLALEDTQKGLGKPAEQIKFETRYIGRPCHIIEVYQEPNSLPPYDQWEEQRYEWLTDEKGVTRKVDLLGEYPANGRYIYCFPLLNENGEAMEPNRSHIEEAKSRYNMAVNDKRSPNERIQDDFARIQKLDNKVKLRYLEQLEELSPLTLKKIEGAEVSKPITKVKT